jgi:CHAT domain-containing protein
MKILALLIVSALLSPSPPHGVEVEGVLRDSAGYRAGLQPGDRLLSRSEDGRETPLSSPFDLAELETTEGPLRPVTFRVSRSGDEVVVAVGPGEWGLQLQPTLADEVRRLYEAGRAASHPDERARQWRIAAARASEDGQRAAAIWLYSESGRVSAEATDAERAEAAFREADALAADDPVLHVQLALAQGRAFQRSAETYDRAEEVLREALRLRESSGGSGLATAAAEAELGLCLLWRGDRAGGTEDLYRRAFERREALAPDSVVHADSLLSMAYIDYALSQLDSAERRTARALAIAEALEPHGAVTARALLNLGRVAWARGRLADAVECFDRVRRLREPIEPDGLEVAKAYYCLGLMARERGDLTSVDRWLDAAIDAYHRRPPNVADLTAAIEVRSLVAYQRGDVETARSIRRRTTSVRERLNGASIGTGLSHLNLGHLALRMEELDEAETEYNRALAIFERHFPGTQWHSEALRAAGDVARRRGDWTRAGSQLEQALALEQTRAPGALPMAAVLQSLGELARAKGDADTADERYREALRVRQSLAPGTQMVAESLLSLGLVARDRARSADARRFFTQAAEAVEQQSTRVGGGQEARSAFHAQHVDVHRTLLAFLVDQGENEEALHVLERSRARVLLELMAERDLALPQDVPADLERERRELNAAYVEAERDLAATATTGAASTSSAPGATSAATAGEAPLERLRALQGRRESLAQRIRVASPRAAALRYPEPLDAAGVAAALDPGTLLLAFSVGSEKTHLFAVESGAPLTVHVLPIGEDALRKRVEAFRTLVTTRYEPSRDVRAEARALFDTLLGPIEPRLAGAARLVICPDGPLHLLPFAALVHGNQFLVEWKPLHFVASATLYSELKRERSPGIATGTGTGAGTGTSTEPTTDLVAFGDPSPDPRQASPLEPLPAARREIAALRSLFGSRAHTFVGGAASETRACNDAREARYVHFACHAVIDDRLPLDSALMLSPEGEADGRLETWEVFERVRLRADLVTLSGCQTALGREAGGEGLLSLTRAFLFAGARATLASLWSVPDTTTSQLMVGVYRRVLRGDPKDSALRGAQLQMVRGSPLAAPYYWAAFQLYGDWR